MEIRKRDLYIIKRGLNDGTYFALYNPENKRHIQIFQISDSKLQSKQMQSKNIIHIDTGNVQISKSDILKRIRAARELSKLIDYLRYNMIEIDRIAEITEESLLELNSISNPEYYLKHNSAYFIDKGRALMRYVINKRNVNGMRLRVELGLQYI